MLRVELSKSRIDHVTIEELYSTIPRITDTILEQRLRFSGQYSILDKHKRSKNRNTIMGPTVVGVYKDDALEDCL